MSELVTDRPAVNLPILDSRSDFRIMQFAVHIFWKGTRFNEQRLLN